MQRIFEIIEKINDIEKAWKKQPIGTVSTRKDGHQYRKVAETGNMDQDWKLVVKDKAESGEPKKEGNKPTTEVKGGNSKVSKEDLQNHAKNTSETALQAAVKGSADAEVRKIAHEEIDRRSKEEAIQEEKKEETKPAEKNKTETKSTETKKSEEKKENPFTEKFRELSDSQVQFYLDAPDGDVKNSAKEVLKERGLRTVSQKEYESEFKDYSGHFEGFDPNNDVIDENSKDGLKMYKNEANKIDSYLDKNSDIEKSVGEYVGSLFEPLRRFLSDPVKYEKEQEEANKDNKFLTRSQRGDINNLKEASENLSKLISDNKINENLTLFRSVSANSFFTGLNIGDIYEDKSFSSTSLEKLKFGEFKIKILAKKGSNVANLSNIEESEFLIDKGSKFRVVSGALNNITVELL